MTLSNPRRIRVLATALTILAAGLAGGLAVGTATPAAAAPPVYVALGDSYASGTGTRSYVSDGTTCQRSTLAYPSLLAAQRGWSLNFRACSGARVADVAASQLSALSSGTSYVTLSVGGNDAGFADVLTECATPWWAGDCDTAVDRAQAYITGTLPGSLRNLYAQVRTRAPYAKVVVVGYPRVFMGEDCNAGTWFSPAEQTRLNQTADLLNSVLRQEAASRGFTFANPTQRFTGHAVCDDVEWINGLSSPVAESYHPNRPGHSSGYLPLVGLALTGTSTAVSPATLTAARASGDEIAAQQRGYAARDARIEPDPFRAPVVGRR